MSTHARMATTLGEGLSPSLTYEPFFGLREKAFSLSADPRFLYTGPAHVHAFEQLLAGIRRREGLIVLSGEIGTGKTTLCRGVLEHLDRRTFTTFVRDPFLSREDLLKTLLIDFGVMSIADLKSGRLAGATRPDLSYPLYEFLDSLVPLQAFAVLIIDEAQNLSPELLEEIRILSELEAREKLLQVVLVGQPELKTQLKLPQLRQVDQRVSVRCELGPMSAEEVQQYIAHRLRVASVGDPAVEFTRDAVALVAQASGGVPRVINLICDRALYHGFVTRAIDVEVPHVTAALVDLQMHAADGGSSEARFSAAEPDARRYEPEVPVAPDDHQSAVTADGHTVEARDAEIYGHVDSSVHDESASSERSQLAVLEFADPLEEFSHEADLARPSSSRVRVIAALTTTVIVAAGAAVIWWSATRNTPLTRADGMASASVTATAASRAVESSLPPVPITTSQRSQTESITSVSAPTGEQSGTQNEEGDADTIAANGQPVGDVAEGPYAIQVASFQSRNRAARLVRELEGSGYRAEAIAVSLGQRGLWWQVVAGRYPSPEEAERHLTDIRERPFYSDARVTMLETP